jgi:hypothetical protein
MYFVYVLLDPGCLFVTHIEIHGLLDHLFFLACILFIFQTAPTHLYRLGGFDDTNYCKHSIEK